MRRVITYGTFDVLHYGHINLLKRAKALGDYLIVVLSSDEFNQIKNKKSFYTYEQRKMILEALGAASAAKPFRKRWGFDTALSAAPVCKNTPTAVRSMISPHCYVLKF